MEAGTDQASGDVYHALGKLNHAHDLWNSRIFLVGEKKSFEDKAGHLLAGTFHEIASAVHLLDVERIDKLHSLKRDIRNLEEELRLMSRCRVLSWTLA